jgi:hypothetical protein
MQQRHLLQTEKVAGQMKLLYPTEKWLCNQFKWICDERLIARAVELLMLLASMPVGNSTLLFICSSWIPHISGAHQLMPA